MFEMIFQELLNRNPYSLNKVDKNKILGKILNNLSINHYNNCEDYKKILDSIDYNVNSNNHINDIPFIPVRLFKMFDLKSISNNNVFKVMTSSGTTGQKPSKIYLDKKAASMQTKVLTKIVSTFIGQSRVPMIIVDSESILKNRKMFSARGAGILGFSIFGNKKIFALDDKMNIQIDLIQKFIETYKNEKILIFGFTFMIWEYFCNELSKRNIKLDLSNCILIHGGGWKKLANKSVSNHKFKKKLNKHCKIVDIHDYYGMVEQTGSIFMECEHGFLHSPIFSDIIIRRSSDFELCEIGEKGIVQVLSTLPTSYPGHSLLTEDEGVLYGEDNCKCGRLGKYFKINGRLKNAELRGCSDTYE